MEGGGVGDDSCGGRSCWPGLCDSEVGGATAATLQQQAWRSRHGFQTIPSQSNTINSNAIMRSLSRR